MPSAVPILPKFLGSCRAPRNLTNLLQRIFAGVSRIGRFTRCRFVVETCKGEALVAMIQRVVSETICRIVHGLVVILALGWFRKPIRGRHCLLSRNTGANVGNQAPAFHALAPDHVPSHPQRAGNMLPHSSLVRYVNSYSHSDLISALG
jgi:hypothetical protein